MVLMAARLHYDVILFQDAFGRPFYFGQSHSPPWQAGPDLCIRRRAAFKMAREYSLQTEWDQWKERMARIDLFFMLKDVITQPHQQPWEKSDCRFCCNTLYRTSSFGSLMEIFFYSFYLVCWDAPPVNKHSMADVRSSAWISTGFFWGFFFLAHSKIIIHSSQDLLALFAAKIDCLLSSCAYHQFHSFY